VDTRAKSFPAFGGYPWIFSRKIPGFPALVLFSVAFPSADSDMSQLALDGPGRHEIFSIRTAMNFPLYAIIFPLFPCAPTLFSFFQSEDLFPLINTFMPERNTPISSDVRDFFLFTSASSGQFAGFLAYHCKVGESGSFQNCSLTSRFSRPFDRTLLPPSFHTRGLEYLGLLFDWTARAGERLVFLLSLPQGVLQPPLRPGHVPF